LAQTTDLEGLLKRANEAFDAQSGKDQLNAQYQAKFKVQSGTAPNADIVYESVMETLQKMAPKDVSSAADAKPISVVKGAVGLALGAVMAAFLMISTPSAKASQVTPQSIAAHMALAAVSSSDQTKPLTPAELADALRKTELNVSEAVVGRIANVIAETSVHRTMAAQPTKIYDSGQFVVYMSLLSNNSVHIQLVELTGKTVNESYDLRSGKFTPGSASAMPVLPPAVPPVAPTPAPAAPPTSLPKPSAKPAKPDSSLASTKPTSPPLVDQNLDSADGAVPVLTQDQMQAEIERKTNEKLAALHKAPNPPAPVGQGSNPASGTPVSNPAQKSRRTSWWSKKWNGLSHWSLSGWKSVANWFHRSHRTVNAVHPVSQKQSMNSKESVGTWRPVTWIVMTVIVGSLSTLLGYILLEPAKRLLRKDATPDNLWPVLFVMALFAHHAWSPLSVYLSFALTGLRVRRLGWSRSSEVPSSDLLGASA
jgi:hypothetical protein